MKVFISLCTAFSLMFLLAGCSGKTVDGKGKIQTINHKVSKFNKVDIGGDFKVDIRRGKSQRVRIKTDSNLQEYITVSVSDKTLRIETKKFYNINPTKQIEVRIRVPKLEKVTLSGSTNANIRNIRGDDFTLDVNGSTKAKLRGYIDDLIIRSNGSGDINARYVTAKHVKVKISGSGNVVVNAREGLNVDIAGSGNVKYYGRPEMEQKVAGSGKIERAK